MQKLYLMFLFALVSCAAVGQNEGGYVKSISVEGLGAHTFVGVNYDARLKGNSGFGYRVGVGYAGGGSDVSFFFGSSKQRTKGVNIPLEINYLLGKKRSKLELGIGAALGYYRVRTCYESQIPNAMGEYETLCTRENTFGYLMFANVGYRLQPVRGFMFRVGVTPSWDFGGRKALSRGHLYPYIALGYAF